MRNASRFLAILGVAAVVIAVSTPALAVCSPPKTASTFTADVLNYVYIDLGTGVTASQVVGSYYDLNGNTSGSYGANQWLFVDVGGKLSMSANLGAAGTIGCPSGKLIVRAQAATASGVKFVTMVANEGISNPNGANFDFSFGKAPGTVFVGASIPRPRVTSSGRSGSNVNLVVNLDSTTGGNAGDSSSAVTAYEILKPTVAGSDPGRDPAGWTVLQTVPAPNGAEVTALSLVADCSNPAVDQFFATRAVFGTSKSELVSDSTRVNCNPNLAEPRFNVIPKRPTGPKKPTSPHSN